MFIKAKKDLEDILNNSLEKVNSINIKKGLNMNSFCNIKKTSNKSFNITLHQNNLNLGDFNLDDYPKLKCLFEHKQTFVADYNCKTSEFNVVTFVDLHGHTGFSLLDGMIKTKDFSEKTVYSRAISDHGVMYGCIDFYKLMKKSYKKPIIGFEAYTEDIDGQAKKHHMVLIAKSKQGYKNISMLSTLSNSNYGGSFPKRPIVKYEWIRKYSEDVICLTACLGGEIQQNYLKGEDEKAEIVAKELYSIFGEDFYIEIQRHNIECELELNRKLIDLAKRMGVKIVATSDAHYLNKEDSVVHEIHLCNQVKKTLSDPTRYKFPGEDYHIHTIEEMELKFKDVPEALFNTLEIMDKCNFDFEFGNYKLPQFPIPKEYSEAEYLKKLTWEGFYKRFPEKAINTSKEYIERINFELEVIAKMGYDSYFLIVWDFVKYAKDKNYPVGPGRGSACGSLVSYCLQITDVNPIPYNLLFERFLNPDRKSMPDIDMDFGNIIREDVINYCRDKYGAENVSRIITFSTLASKAVVRDVSKIMFSDIEDKNLGNMISKTIPTKPNMTIEKAFKESPEFKLLYDTNAKAKQIIDNATILEGLPKACSQHACGLIISDQSIRNYCPQVFLEDKKTGIIAPTTQYTMGECEEIGLLKMDFLGLKTMTVLDENVKDINEIYMKNITIEDIPLNDPLTYENISKGKTKGVFQLESNGMTSFMNKLFQDVSSKISNINKTVAIKEREESYAKLGNILFERLIAGISLYRPGPMEEIPRYIDGMINPTHIAYDTSELEDILNVTYGVIVYQEQVIMTVRKLAGFTKGQADLMRKAMGKKIEAILNEYEPYFINGSGDKIDSNTGKPIGIRGCVEMGIKEPIAKKIWDRMYEFAKYAFNKSHAAGYAVIGIRTGWVNTHHPVIFMKANLNSYIDLNKKLKPFLSHCYNENIKILTPSVNQSKQFFTVHGKEEGIRYGLRGLSKIKSLSDLILKEKDDRGLFLSYQDFVERMVAYQRLSKDQITSLIYSGALDEFEGTRKAKILMVNSLQSLAKSSKKAIESGQITLFDFAEAHGVPEIAALKHIKTLEVEEFEKGFLLEKEKEYSGAYITGHPLDDFQDFLKKQNVIEISELIENVSDYEDGLYEEFNEEDSLTLTEDVVQDENVYMGQVVSTSGIITEVIPRYDKRGKMFMTFTIEDRTGELSIVCFNRELAKNQEKIIVGKKVVIKGEFNVNDFGPQIVAKTIFDLEYDIDYGEKITIYGSKDLIIARNQWKSLVELMSRSSFNGNTKVIFIKDGNKYLLPNGINLNLTTLTKLQYMFGKENCKPNNEPMVS